MEVSASLKHGRKGTRRKSHAIPQSLNTKCTKEFVLKVIQDWQISEVIVQTQMESSNKTVDIT